MEQKIRCKFNRQFSKNATKQRLPISGKRDGTRTTHEFDLYDDPGCVIGGISCGRWKTKSENNNTGSQDRVTAELLYLSLWPGRERRYLLLEDEEMANNIFRRFRTGRFRREIQIWRWISARARLKKVGVLG